jgi:hypothetical protein
MKSFLLVLAGMALSASVGPDTDYPHRDWGQVVTLDMTVEAATTCIATTLNRDGDVLVVPVDGGSDIAYTLRKMWGPKGEPWERFKVRGEDGGATLRVFYRHPLSVGKITKHVGKLQKRCLKVR